MRFHRDLIKPRLAEFATRGVFIGTSSWKYPGWQGQLYDRDRYIWRGRYAESRFERNCLAEYAEVFPTVSVDAAYYKFPDEAYLQGLPSQVPDGFQFAFKVTDDITLKQFPQLHRFGMRAGRPNENFLNAELFGSRFLGPCESIRPKIGLIMFEFARLSRADYRRGREFAACLDKFFDRLPKGWPLAVEIRNPEFLQPDYFALLAKHDVAHIFNSWTGMPPVSEQMGIGGCFTSGRVLGARFLLKPGRKYEEAVKAFSPYESVKDVYPEGRDAAVNLINQGLARPQSRTFIYVNNRFEGSALDTIAAVLEELGKP